MNRGYVTLISILVVGAIGTAIAISLILLGISSSRTSFSVEQSNQAKGLANACVEEALQQVRNTSSFIGDGALTLGHGTCAYIVTSQGGENRIITASGTVGSIVRKVTVVINRITPLINLISWQEVVD